MVDRTIDYYNKKAQEFYNSTLEADMTDIYSKFLKHVKPGGRILDAGCGSGRDSLYFINNGYSVIAFDASEEMVKLSSCLIKQVVQKATFQEININEKVDGIWACSSLLHVSRDALTIVLRRFCEFLIPKGVFYMSFKYGDAEYIKDGRYFNCYDESTLINLINQIPEFKIHQLFRTCDVRPEKRSEEWLNVLLIKN